MTDTLESEGRRIGARLHAAYEQRAAAVAAAREYVHRAHAAGVSESELARLLDTNRLTIRRWRGKT